MLNILTLARDVKGADEQQIEEMLENVKKNGFINYYGLQRFGTSSAGTHEYGRLILRGDWKGAVHLLLAAKTEDTPDVTAARDSWKNGNGKEALKLFHRRFTAERVVLEYLNGRDNPDYRAAICAIPRMLRNMYCHAWQSFVWNKAVSARMKLSRGPMIGDLVVADADWQNEESGKTLKRADKVQIITTMEEAETWTMHHVVLPLPGPSIAMPQGAVLDAYNAVLMQENISLASMNAIAKDFTLYGSLRRVLATPSVRM